VVAEPVEAADVGELIAAYPGLRIDHDNERWYAGLLARRLLNRACTSCGLHHHPPRPVCPGCWSTALVDRESRGTGVVEASTTFRQVDPYGLDDGASPGGRMAVTVRLDEQDVRLTGPVRAGAAAGIGERVRLGWARRGPAPFPVFEPESR
ncbi:MAG: Zn-ribbon domain-containing OB-fold protein, partial [Acidimicrobiia bacterium]